VLEHAVAGRPDDGVMELAVGVRLGALIVPRGSLPHRRDQLLQPGQRRVVDPRGRGARGDPFERRADRVDLEEFVRGDLAHLGAAERRADHEPEQCQVAQRFPHRGLADAELLRQAGLDNTGAGRQSSAQDVVDQLFANLVSEYPPLHRLRLVGFFSHQCPLRRTRSDLSANDYRLY
jgi:hypothetical protein